MSLVYIEQIFQGCIALYLLFIAWNFTTRSFINFIVFKFTPLALALEIIIIQLLEAGYIVKVP